MAKVDECVLPGTFQKADITFDMVKDYIRSNYGLTVNVISELSSYDDQTFHVKIREDSQICNDHLFIENINYEDGYVFKISNLHEARSEIVINAQTRLLILLNQSGFHKCPMPIRRKDVYYHSSSTDVKIKDAGSKKCMYRLFHYVPGKTLNQVKTPQQQLLKNYGAFIANLNEAMNRFGFIKDTRGYSTHKTIWSLTMIPYLKARIDELGAMPYDSQLIHEMLDTIKQATETYRPQLGATILHGDLNSSNIIVTDDELDVKAVLDFGDSHAGYPIYELATAFANLLLHTGSMEQCKAMLDGYRAVRELRQAERRVFRLLIICRLLQNLLRGAIMVHSKDELKLTHDQVKFYTKDVDEKYSVAKTLYELGDTGFLEPMGMPIE